MKKVDAGGGWPAIRYTLRKAREVGGWWKLWKAMRSRNACKTCALGMGGQRGGMVNESGRFPEVCKKSLQAMAADMQGAIPDSFWNTYTIEQLRKFTPQQLETCGRLVTPLRIRCGETNYRPISWEEALGAIADKLRQTEPDRTFWYFSGRSSNEAGFLLQLFARLYGTNNVNNCSYYCHQASGVGLSSAIGSGTATVVLEDLEHADCVFLIGGNPASNHPRLMTSLMHLRRRGGEVIVINPVIETGLVKFRIPSSVRSLLFGTKIATTYVQVDIGGDLALLTGVAKRIVEMGAQDKEFLQNHCEGVEPWLQSLAHTSWDEITAKSGCTRQDIDAVAEKYASAKRVVFSWTMGITHHVHGVENVQAIANLALLRGMVGRPHAGLMPIRGHSNVQGVGSVGVTPQLKQAIFERLESHFKISLPTTPGLDTLGCMEAAERRELKVGFCLGGNLFGSNPDADFADHALQQLELLVGMNTTLNTGHAHGLAEDTIVLPVLARDEEPQMTTQESMFNFVRLSDGGPARHTGPRSEVEVIADLAARVQPSGPAHGPFDWSDMRDTGAIRQAIARVVPGFEQIERIAETKQEFQIAGRTFHEPRFATASERARIHTHTLPELRGGDRQLRMMTVRSEGQFNTVVYEEEDLYRGIDRRNVILIHPDDFERLGVAPDQTVTVRSETGELPGIIATPFEAIKPGNALMYFPEANVLVPRRADRQSRTPAYKNILVTVE
ncbi:MAG: FdhF/YdeP family oxidoreductase [Planctomycetales bacterium]|nr:FdhF/YdeP family oxidoreductase [Planctomycetales bacterium]